MNCKNCKHWARYYDDWTPEGDYLPCTMADTPAISSKFRPSSLMVADVDADIPDGRKVRLFTSPYFSCLMWEP